MPEKIGLEAVFQDKDFRRGLSSYTAGVNQATQATDQAASRITQSTKGIGQAWQTMVGTVSGLISVYLIKQVAQAAWQFGQLGAVALQQRDAFQELARQAGGSSDEILAALKRATGGTVAQADIIMAANRGILLGLGAQADQWEDLAEVARFRARAMGLSVTQALNDITTGIGRQSKLILDNLGIILDTEQVYADYADSIGKSADALSDMEKKQAFVNAVIIDGQKQIQAAGGIAEDAADQFAEFQVTLDDLKTSIAIGLAPTIADLASGMTKFINETLIGFQLLNGVLNGTISVIEYFTLGTEAQRIATEQGTDAAREYVTALLAEREGLSLVNDTAGDYYDRLKAAEQAADAAAASALRAAAGFRELAGSFTVTPLKQVLAQAEAAKRGQQQAEEDRVKANEQALKEMERNEQSYANALGQLYDQIVTAGQRAAQDRLKADQDYVDAALKLEQDLADERAQILRDLAQADEDARRKADQDREDAARKLARDLEDLQLRLAERNADTWADYYRTIEELALEHGERLKSITERYASEAEAIAKKYSLEPEPPSVDAQRQALMDELKALRAIKDTRGISTKQRQMEIEAELEALKQAELAALDERKQAELDAEEAAYQEQVTREQQRRDEQLAANQAQYDKEAEQKRLAYDRELEDLRLAQAREQEERNVAAQRALDDLQRQGEAQRAELASQYRARLAEITQGLATESQAFRDAYTNELRDLDTYLAQRTQKWQDHLRQVEGLLGIGSPSKWMEDIGKQMRAGLDKGFSGPSVATDLQQAVASFGRGNSLGLPMAAGGGSSTSNVTTNHNLSVNATYTRPQSERSLRQDLSLYHTMLRMRTG